jgi:NADH:ubiquinone oxidoreductase subunit K
MSGPVGIIYCGSCGALNPRTNHFCSACGHQLVDAYHPSEGLRVYATADPAAPLVDIVDPDSDITVVETEEELPADFAKVTLEDGRLGYVRLREVADVAGGLEPGERRARPAGCISSTAVLAAIVLMVLAAAFVLVTALRSSDDTAGFIAVLTCITVVPAMLFVVGFYLYVRKREDELADEAEEAELRERTRLAGDQPAGAADA